MDRKITLIITFVLVFAIVYGYTGLSKNNNLTTTNVSAHEVNCSRDANVEYYGYFCTNMTDTSAYSFWMNGENGHVYIIYFDHDNTNSVYEKMSESDNKKGNKSPMRFKNRTFDDMTREFDTCLNMYTKKHSLDSLTKIVINLDILGDYSVNINKHLYSLCPKKLPRDYYCKQFYLDVEAAISKSKLKDRMNEIVNKYGIKVENIEFSDEYSSYIKNDEFLKKNIINSKDVPSKILSGIATCLCSPMK